MTLFFAALLGNVADLHGQATNASVTMKVDPITGFLEIKNGLCGIIIPWKQAISKKEYKYAPIQAIVYADGQRSDNTVNYLQAPTDPISFKPSVLVQTETEIKNIIRL